MQAPPAEAHLSDGEVVQWIDGALAGAGRDRADAHLAACGACAGRLRQLRGRSAALARLLAEADWEPPTAPGELAVRRTRRPAVAWLRGAAAAAAVVLVASAAASPLRARMMAWVAHGWEWAAGDARSANAPPPLPSGVPAPTGARVRFVPAGGEFTLEFEHVQAGGAVELVPSGSDSAAVEQMAGAAAEVLVIPGEARVRVRNRASDAADYRVRIPDDVPRVRVRVGGRPPVEIPRARVTDGERISLGRS